MSVTNTSIINQNVSVQAQTNVNNQAEGIKQNTESSTNINSYNGTVKNLTTSSTTKSRNIEKALADTYRLNKTDAENIQSFVSALSQHIDKHIDKQSVLGTAESWGSGGAGIVEDLKSNLKTSEKLRENIAKNTNIKAGFFTKLKSLCARIASFFGNNSKLEKLQNEGIAQFKELKSCLTTGLVAQQFLASFIENHADDEKVMNGLVKCLGNDLKSKILDGSVRIKNKNFFSKESFFNSIDLKNKQEVEGFVKAWIWADQNMVQESLEKQLKIPNKELKVINENNDKAFNKDNQIFADVARGYTFTFITEDNKQITLREAPREKLFNNIKDQFQTLQLTKAQMVKIKSFCANFSTQGCLDCRYNNNKTLHIEGNGCPTFTVKFTDD